MNERVEIELMRENGQANSYHINTQEVLMTLYGISSPSNMGTYVTITQGGFLENSWGVAKIQSGFSLDDIPFGIGPGEYMEFSKVRKNWYKWNDS